MHKGKLLRLGQVEWFIHLLRHRALARPRRIFAQSLGFRICTTAIRSPQSNKMAEAFVKTFKVDYVYLNDVLDAETVMKCLPLWAYAKAAGKTIDDLDLSTLSEDSKKIYNESLL